MQTTGSPPTRQDRARKSGYGVAVVVNATLLVFVINLLDWELLPFLTEGFEAVVPWISLSLVASLVANGGHGRSRDRHPRRLGQAGVNRRHDRRPLPPHPGWAGCPLPHDFLP